MPKLSINIHLILTSVRKVNEIQAFSEGSGSNIYKIEGLCWVCYDLVLYPHTRLLFVIIFILIFLCLLMPLKLAN